MHICTIKIRVLCFTQLIYQQIVCSNKLTHQNSLLPFACKAQNSRCFISMLKLQTQVQYTIPFYLFISFISQLSLRADGTRSTSVHNEHWQAIKSPLDAVIYKRTNGDNIWHTNLIYFFSMVGPEVYGRNSMSKQNFLAIHKIGQHG
jgi:hypothetical protein